ncbi:MAG: hypothetical protein SW833_28735 [Cyanobacteriota bacterium]|nr:hypothetical protein [Cyanobacteriota bacterium]
MRQAVSTQVRDEQNSAVKPIEEKTQQSPDTSGIEPRQSSPMQPTPASAIPGSIGAEKATPKPKSEGEVSAPLQVNSQSTEQQRSQVADRINGIYQTTKTEVETALNGLESEVVSQFDSAANSAKQTFENYVESKMSAYKQERYGEWYDVSGWDERISDAVTGLPPEVNQFFIDGKQQYINQMDIALTGISNLVAEKLNTPKQKIAQGEEQIQEYVARGSDRAPPTLLATSKNFISCLCQKS